MEAQNGRAGLNSQRTTTLLSDTNPNIMTLRGCTNDTSSNPTAGDISDTRHPFGYYLVRPLCHGPRIIDVKGRRRALHIGRINVQYWHQSQCQEI